MEKKWALFQFLSLFSLFNVITKFNNFLPTNPKFSWHETGTTHIFHLGLMCRNCYSKLQNLDQRCRLFYEECQRNARIVMRANTKRMMRSSPLSGPQKRVNFSKTPTKTRKTQRKTQLFKEKYHTRGNWP